MIIHHENFMKLQQRYFKIIFFLSSLLISQTTFAASPFPLDVKMLEPLKNNPNVLSYKIHKIDNKTVVVDGKLSDGNALKIRLRAGDAFSKTCQKIIPSSKPSLTDQTYWLQQASLFAKQIWSEENAALFKQDIEEHKFVATGAAKNKLEFEKYSEGGYQSIQIVQSHNETVIILQQSAC